MSYQAKIWNLPDITEEIRQNKDYADVRVGDYVLGHRDARQAAMAIGAEADREIARLTAPITSEQIRELEESLENARGGGNYGDVECVASVLGEARVRARYHRQIEAADRLAEAVASIQARLGCGCSGPICLDCAAVDTQAEDALAAYRAAKEGK